MSRLFRSEMFVAFRRYRAITFSLVLLHSGVLLAKTSREVVTAKSERIAFSMWHFLSGSPERIERTLAEGVSPRSLVEITVGDGRIIRGFKLATKHQPEGALLIIQGNCWLADRLLPRVESFCESGFDVFVFDFRGYGISKPGISRIGAIIDDYRDIIRSEPFKTYKGRFLYAFSFGGIIATKLWAESADFQRIVIDSVPSSTAAFNLNINYSPEDNLPTDFRNITVLVGDNDPVLNFSRTSEFFQRMARGGANCRVRVDDIHPFEDKTISGWTARSNEISKELLYGKAGP